LRRLTVPPAAAVALLALAGVAASSTNARAGNQPMQTAVFAPTEFSGSSAPVAARMIRREGATAVRLMLSWRSVAPSGTRKPAGFRASDPADSRYRWRSFDALVRIAASRGLDPIVDIVDAPSWAQGRRRPFYGQGAVEPNPVEFGRFARAAAERYSGSYNGLPRVRYWEVWNEPNLSTFLNPQFVNGKPASPDLYRAMVNSFAAGVKAVHLDNLVIAGSTAPFRDITPYVVQADQDWGPLSFMRRLLCLSKFLTPTCHDPIRFDIWSHHPYTSGGPTHEAILADDVSLGDLPQMRTTLETAFAVDRIRTTLPEPGFWVTEFSWDSNPPDPLGVPTALEARWVAQGLYVMWKNGISLVTWFSIRDEAGGPYQSGLYFRRGASLAAAVPKPASEAFRFPVVAFPRKGGVYVWGRTPSGQPGRVIVEQSTGGWKRLGVLQADRYGIFEGVFATDPTGTVRARLPGETSRPFSLKAVRDQGFNPFGDTHAVEPPAK
jgi:Cellulase (glycosyl hydrolase family 5)